MCVKEVKKRLKEGWNGWRKVSGVIEIKESSESSDIVWFKDVGKNRRQS